MPISTRRPHFSSPPHHAPQSQPPRASTFPISSPRRPNEALLSINCFQKNLGDPNPLVRASALRAIAGIHLHEIASLVLVAVTKCARDPSVYVRKCADNALPKLHDLLMEEITTTIEEKLQKVMRAKLEGKKEMKFFVRHSLL